MGLREMVPASSRSFWQLYGEVERLQREVESLRNEMGGLRGDLKEARRLLEKADRDRRSQMTRSDLMMWEAMRRDDEPLLDTKKRFFGNVPPATGGMRLLQEGSARLLVEFDEICQEKDIPYWMAYGTLLGAVRHQGFVPWDDDVDLGMMREDIARLQDAVADDPRHRVTVVYDSAVQCRQIRFRYRDEENPCLLDLFIFDYATSSDYSVFERMNAVRADMIQEMHDSNMIVESRPGSGYYLWPNGSQMLGQDEEGADEVSALFDRARQRQVATVPEMTEDRTVAKGIVWGVDNIYDFNHYDWCCPVESVFPTKRMVFEGHEANAPADHEKFLVEVFGDYMALPRDLGQHLLHMSHDALETPQMQAVLRRCLE